MLRTCQWEGVEATLEAPFEEVNSLHENRHNYLKYLIFLLYCGSARRCLWSCPARPRKEASRSPRITRAITHGPNSRPS
jgi:hypothetical protein